jgi:D-ribose pyranase
MRLTGKILNPQLVQAIAGLGHRDRLVVTDAGLPLPAGTPRLDLSVVAGMPSLVDVLSVVLEELKVEAAYVAEEFAPESPGTYKPVAALLSGCELRHVPHTQLEEMLPTAKLIVRTGEFSHYANVVLVGGVTF